MHYFGVACRKLTFKKKRNASVAPSFVLKSPLDTYSLKHPAIYYRHLFQRSTNSFTAHKLLNSMGGSGIPPISKELLIKREISLEELKWALPFSLLFKDFI